VTCEACGGDLERDVAELEVKLGARRVTVAQPGWYCWDCGAARFSARDLHAADRQLSAGARLEGVVVSRAFNQAVEAA
jgi:YgiT-type zinc finger domain-containing protein